MSNVGRGGMGDVRATDALVGKFMRTMAQAEWMVTRVLQLWSGRDPFAKPRSDRRTLYKRCAVARAIGTGIGAEVGLRSADVEAYLEAVDIVDRWRGLRNDLAHAVVLQFQQGLAVRSGDGTTRPLTADVIDTAGADVVYAVTVLDDIYDRMLEHFERVLKT